MIKIVWNDHFKNRYKKWARKHPDLIKTFAEKIILFERDPHHTSLKTHPLKGKLKETWSLYINYEHRLTFRFVEEKSKAILINIGTHDEVY